MDQQLLERTAEDVSGDPSTISSSLFTLQQAAVQLRTVVTHKFDEAVKSEDLASVERFFKIFPLLGMHLEGLKKFCSYLCSKVISLLLHNYMNAYIHRDILHSPASRYSTKEFESCFRDKK